MNNYRQIQNQWSPMDMQAYPHLFKFVADRIAEGLRAGEKISKEM